MNIYRLHFEGSWSYEFDVDNDPAPKVTLLENDDD